MKKTVCKIIAGVYMVLCCAGANAGPLWCQGTVSDLFTYAEGSVLVLPSFRGDYVRVCNINVEIGGVSPVNCLAWFAVLKSAVQRQSQVIFHYVDAPACNGLPTYGNAPIPGYVMQRN